MLAIQSINYIFSNRLKIYLGSGYFIYFYIELFAFTSFCRYLRDPVISSISCERLSPMEFNRSFMATSSCCAASGRSLHGRISQSETELCCRLTQSCSSARCFCCCSSSPTDAVKPPKWDCTCKIAARLAKDFWWAVRVRN